MWTLSGFADEIGPDLDQQCAVLDDLGVRFLELRSAWSVNVVDLDDDQVEWVRATLAAHGIGVSSIGSPCGKVAITDPPEHDLARLDRALQVARRLDAPYLRLFSFFLRGAPPEQHRDEVIRRLAVYAARARDAGITLLHENEKEIYGDVPSRALDVVESVSSEHLRLAWDAANYVQVGVRPFTEAYAALRPYTDYVQVKDALLADASVVAAGEGDGEIRETVRALRADGFDGFFSMEPHLAAQDAFGGFSGVDEFVRATKTFTRLLDDEGIEFS
ncbi:sugar phosphate isomerase/epimerase [Actinomycetospora endophytica]|uniref:Sugar phosphate isomerase/epimerase n=1 Tax=Actinomycetospora endophytica TaxID=2291215 RepID=A0ABS8PDW6_9PSEU|nr:sugar phosphate isomerase/epimerase family protein [Actinomycetospora endophytica]MCD2195596.1 sugar phosphate isomerase/epimerase [Actinomycetospora endophytica]